MNPSEVQVSEEAPQKIKQPSHRMRRNIVLVVIIVALVTGLIYYVRQLGVGENEPTKHPSTAGGTVTPASLQKADEPELGFTFSLPGEYVVENNGQFSRLYRKQANTPGAGPTNFLYISVVPKGKENAEGEIYNYNAADLARLRRLQAGGTVVLGNAEQTGQAAYFTYKRIDDAMIGGYGAQGYMNEKPWEFPQGTTEYRYIIPFEQATYLIGGYLGSDAASGSHISKTEMDTLFANLKITPDTVTTAFTSPIPEGQWKTFSNASAGITLEYPSGWTERRDGQNFPEGDLLTLTAIGQTQRTGTELYDGVSFAVMKPIADNGNLQQWVKERYAASTEMSPDRPPQYSQVTFGGIVYEKVIVCGLGCFTYYHTLQDGKIYGFMVNAVGPNATTYESAVSRSISSAKYK